MIYTSRFANAALKTGEYTTVRISVGTPRWTLGYNLTHEMKELMPFGLRNVEDKEEFRGLFYAKLDNLGVDAIGRKLKRLEALGKPVVLLCYEDIRKGDWNWCHRRIFADWWHEKTGETIDELPDTKPVKAPIMDSLF